MKLKNIFIAALALGSLSQLDAQKKPNVIVIMADDLGYNDLGFQGSKHIMSPNLDKLAAGGTIFTDAHVAASVCSPSRAGFITGRYQQRFGHEANCPSPEHGMDVNERTMGQAFQGLGYKTTILGKWHLGDSEDRYPNKRGFDYFWGLREGSRDYWWNPKKSDKPGNPKAIEENGKQVNFEGYLSDRLGDQAIQYIEQNKANPFFMFLSFTAPHAPLQAKKEDLKLCNNDPYAALIYNMDQNIGRVIKSLENCKIRENTMIWFLSDNGGVAKQASNKPLKASKGMKFDGGHRVPFILNWPGHVPSGKVYKGLTSSMDIFPTSFVASGGTLFTDRPLDGVDIMPHIIGKTDKAPHKTLFWRRLSAAAVRVGEWKLIRVNKVGSALYNIKDDISESKNLAKEMPEKVEHLEAALKNWEKEMIAPQWGEPEKWNRWNSYNHKRLMENKPMVPVSKVPKK
jgi:arylsulfatase A-like enzyme